MSNTHWYKRYPADFLHGTSMLSCEQKGAYSVALDLMYERNGPIPDDPRWLARMCGCSVRKWTQTLRPALIEAGKLRIQPDGRLSNGRMEYETYLTDQRIRTRDSGRADAPSRSDAPPSRRHPPAPQPAADVSPFDAIIPPINQPERSNINTPAPDLVAMALFEPAPPASKPAEPAGATLSPVYPADKPPIIEAESNEINAFALADSGLRKKEEKVVVVGTAGSLEPRAEPPPAAPAQPQPEVLITREPAKPMVDRFAPTPPTPRQDPSAAPPRPQGLPEQMIAIWNRSVLRTPIPQHLTPPDSTLRRQLLATLEGEDFRNSLECWETYCEFVARNPFCRGEQNGVGFQRWRAKLAYALRSDVQAQLLAEYNAERLQRRREMAAEGVAPEGGRSLWQQAERDSALATQLHAFRAVCVGGGGSDDQESHLPLYEPNNRPSVDAGR